MRGWPVAFCALVFSLLPLLSSWGQTAAPVVIQAATPGPAISAKPKAAASESGSKSAIQLLQEMKASNSATIKKQEAALATLDELQKAAEEIKIFSKRG